LCAIRVRSKATLIDTLRDETANGWMHPA
jgi:hypothetical protein